MHYEILLSKQNGIFYRTVKQLAGKSRFNCNGYLTWDLSYRSSNQNHWTTAVILKIKYLFEDKNENKNYYL